MRIAIVGAGNVGSALARACAAAGHTVTISSSDPDDARALASGTASSAAATNHEAAATAELVVVAVPYDAVQTIVQEIASEVDGKVLVDVTNRFAPDQLDAPSNAESIQSMAPGAKVVKAFNTVFANNQDDPLVDGVQLDCFVAADDADGRTMVLVARGWNAVGQKPEPNRVARSAERPD